MERFLHKCTVMHIESEARTSGSGTRSRCCGYCATAVLQLVQHTHNSPASTVGVAPISCTSRSAPQTALRGSASGATWPIPHDVLYGSTGQRTSAVREL